MQHTLYIRKQTAHTLRNQHKQTAHPFTKQICFGAPFIDFGFENLDFEVQSKNPQGLNQQKLLNMILENLILI